MLTDNAAQLTFWIRGDEATTMNFFWTGSNSITVPVTTTWTFHSLSNVELWANDPTGKLKVLQVATTFGGTPAAVFLDDIKLIVRLHSWLLFIAMIEPLV